MITAQILKDSVNPHGTRLTSWLLTYPRWLHAEVMTHRQFSRSAASSRAIPFARMLRDVTDKPALPEYWGSEKSGMSSGAELEDLPKRHVAMLWDEMRHSAEAGSRMCHRLGLHKSLANRVLEPWAHITVLFTGTDHSNFFTLRAHPAAMPEFQVLGFRMLDLYLKSDPESIPWGGWHIPRFGEPENVSSEWALLSSEDRVKVAVARCARLSYKTHDGEHSVAADLDLFKRLFGPPMHAGAFEHVAQAVNRDLLFDFDDYPWSNFDQINQHEESGWGQARKLFIEGCTSGLGPNGLRRIFATKPDWITLP